MNMLTDKPIHLLDIDENFIIVTDNLEVEIEYGKFALSSFYINPWQMAMNM